MAVFDSQAFPNAKKDCLAIHPNAVCKKSWSSGTYNIVCGTDVYKTGNGSPAGAWVDYAFHLGLYGVKTA